MFAGDRDGKLIGERSIDRLTEGEADDFRFRIQVERAKVLIHYQKVIAPVGGDEGCVVTVQGERIGRIDDRIHTPRAAVGKAEGVAVTCDILVGNGSESSLGADHRCLIIVEV